jgi:hypothetical protein
MNETEAKAIRDKYPHLKAERFKARINACAKELEVKGRPDSASLEGASSQTTSANQPSSSSAVALSKYSEGELRCEFCDCSSVAELRLAQLRRANRFSNKQEAVILACSSTLVWCLDCFPMQYFCYACCIEFHLGVVRYGRDAVTSSKSNPTNDVAPTSSSTLASHRVLLLTIPLLQRALPVSQGKAGTSPIISHRCSVRALKTQSEAGTAETQSSTNTNASPDPQSVEPLLRDPPPLWVPPRIPSAVVHQATAPTIEDLSAQIISLRIAADTLLKSERMATGLATWEARSAPVSIVHAELPHWVERILQLEEDEEKARLERQRQTSSEAQSVAETMRNELLARHRRYVSLRFRSFILLLSIEENPQAFSSLPTAGFPGLLGKTQTRLV